MLRVLGSSRRLCDGLTRRELLRVGALSAFGGLTLPNLLRAEEQSGVRRPGKAKSVIVLYLLGGAATQDMWDLKPNAPAEIRGEFKPAPTSAPGVHICEHLSHMARWMHKAALVRSVNHKAGCHNTLPSYTGFETTLQDITTTKETYPPSMGSVCSYLKDASEPEALATDRKFPASPRPRVSASLPAYVYLPCYLGWGQAIRRPGPYGGFLGQRFDPLFTEVTPYKDPGTPDVRSGYPQVVRGEPRIPDSVLGEAMTLDRLSARRSLLEQLDDEHRRHDENQASGHFDRTQQRAFDLLTSAKVKAAFDLSKEDARLVDRYGRTLFGNSTLIARRLVEGGVRFVNVTWDIYWERLKLEYDGWDTHTRNFAILKEYNLPYLDLAFSALMEDLQTRGLLDETLVVVMSEMGRTPRVNGNAGRDHWTFCYSVMLAGAGIRGGSVYGASDPHAAYVKDLPVSTADICATIYHCLGVDPELAVYDRTGRPTPVANGGQPIAPILA